MSVNTPTHTSCKPFILLCMGESKDDLLARLTEILGKDRQKDMAAKVGVTQPTVNRWLSGTLPDALSLSRICRALGVNANWLLGVDELAPPIAQEWVALYGDVGAGPAGTERRLNDGYSFDPLAGRDLEFEAECARDQARDDLADWLAAQPGANVVGFRRPARPEK